MRVYDLGAQIFPTIQHAIHLHYVNLMNVHYDLIEIRRRYGINIIDKSERGRCWQKQHPFRTRPLNRDATGIFERGLW